MPAEQEGVPHGVGGISATSGPARRFGLRAVLLFLAVAAVGVMGLARMLPRALRLPEQTFLGTWSSEYAPIGPSREAGAPSGPTGFLGALARAAVARAGETVTYDPSYIDIDYPGGDVAPDRGACTDLVVRAFRDVGVDLQQDVHVEMSAAFDVYPQIWGAEGPDSNIDHRRVPNLMVFFARNGVTLPITEVGDDYTPGDIVIWHLGRGLTHIGIVTHKRAPGTRQPLVAHHIGGRPTLDDVLFRWEIIGHFRYAPTEPGSSRCAQDYIQFV